MRLKLPSLSIVMPYGDERDLRAALRATTMLARYELARYGLPPLYTPGLVQYRWPEPCPVGALPGGCERFLTPRQALMEGGLVDCDDVGPWRAAELQLLGQRAEAEPVDAPRIGWHIVVQHPNGRIEDPSRVVGMK